MQRGIVGQRQRVHALLGHAPDLGGRRLHVPPGRQHQRHEAAGRGVAPVVQVPVVVGLDGGQRHAAVGVALEALPGETRERREAQGAQHAVGIHVIHARLDIPGAAAHVLVAERLHAVFLFRAAYDRIQAHVAGGLFLEHPHVAPAAFDNLGFPALVLGRHVAGEGVRRLDRVVVYADENEVFQFHRCPRVYGLPLSG